MTLGHLMALNMSSIYTWSLHCSTNIPWPLTTSRDSFPIDPQAYYTSNVESVEGYQYISCLLSIIDDGPQEDGGRPGSPTLRTPSIVAAVHISYTS